MSDERILEVTNRVLADAMASLPPEQQAVLKADPAASRAFGVAVVAAVFERINEFGAASPGFIKWRLD